MKTEDMRIMLIKSAIHTISESGIDRATTKLLATTAGLNEAYIYRIFGGKEELFKETFLYIDKQFASYLLKCFKTIAGCPDTIRENFHNVFLQIWDFTLSDVDRCSFFIRYYYSRLYTIDLSSSREKIYSKIMLLIKSIFKDGTDTWWLFNHILDVLFSSAVKVLREEIPNNEQTAEKIFELLYAALEPNFK